MTRYLCQAFGKSPSFSSLFLWLNDLIVKILYEWPNSLALSFVYYIDFTRMLYMESK